MAAYLIGQIIIHDVEKFLPYVANTSAAIAKYGGEVLDVVEAKGGRRLAPWRTDGSGPFPRRSVAPQILELSGERDDEGIASRNSDQPRCDVHFSSGR